MAHSEQEGLDAAGAWLSRFREPVQSDRPGIRWWWQFASPPEVLVAELREIAAAGFGEVEVAFSPHFWADQAQRDALEAVLEEAGKLELGVAITLGAEWPLRTPNTSAATPFAAQELQYGAVFVTSSDDARIVIPSPLDDPDLKRGGDLVAVVVAEVVERHDPVDPTDLAPGHPIPRLRPPSRSTILRDGTATVVTGAVRSDGTLRWRPDAGEWVVIALWARSTVRGATSFLDRHAAIAASEYIDDHQFGDAVRRLLPQVGTDLFEDSLELDADSLFWTSDLIQRFTDRHGYDPTPLLPVLFAQGMCHYWVPDEPPTPDFEFDSGRGAGARTDYYRLLTDMYISDHLAVLQEWAVAHGMKHKAQVAYGQNLDAIRANREFARMGGRPEGESLNAGDRAPVDLAHPTWRFSVDHERTIVGGAHQGGATRISTELGAQFLAAYGQSLSDLKAMLDKEWSVGLTRPFVHGYASQPTNVEWPGNSRFEDFASESWNAQHFPEWSHWRALNDYWARGTVVLESGIPRTDVAIYRDGFLTTAARGLPHEDATVTPRLADTSAFEQVGFTVQYIDPIGLAETAEHARATLYRDSAAYRALIVETPTMTAEAAEAVELAASEGVRVVLVGDAPHEDSGYDPDGSRGHRVRSAFERAIGRHELLRVDRMSLAAGALHSAGLLPRIHTPDLAGPGLLTQWRECGESTLFVIYNPAGEERRVEVSLEGTGAITELDLHTGEMHVREHAEGSERTAVTVDLGPHGLRAFRLGDAGTGATSTAGVRREISLIDWRLTVETSESGESRRIVVPGQGPGDWRGIAVLEHVSGVGRYECRVDLPHGVVEAPLEIQLGQVAGSAEVFVDDVCIGHVFGAADVVRAPRVAASSKIRIDVRTPLRNAAVASGRRPRLEGVTMAHGLMGPVRALVTE